MTKQNKIEELAFLLALTYYTGWTDCKLGVKERKKRSKIIQAIAKKDCQKFTRHATELLNCIIEEKQPKTNKYITNSIMELEV